MGAITPEILYKLEDNMQAITENEMARLVLGENLWWKKLARVRPSANRRETLAWLLSTAKIHNQGKGGNIQFDDMVSQTVDFEHTRFGTGLELDIDTLSDNDGKGFDFAAEWSQQVGALSVYHPQEKIAELILAGETGLAYDGKAYFSGLSDPHPNNPFKTGAGSYANLFTSSSSGVYPGALPIHDSGSGFVSLDTARANVQKALAYIASIRMPNGKSPRRLKVVGLAGPPTMAKRLQEITNARFIASDSANGGGTTDQEAVIANWAFGEPVDMPELLTLGDGTTDLTSWYIITQQVQSTTLGALLYSERMPFKVTYYTGEGGGTGVDAMLDRALTLEWHLKGRNATQYGHPYGLFKAKAA